MAECHAAANPQTHPAEQCACCQCSVKKGGAGPLKKGAPASLLLLLLLGCMLSGGAHQGVARG